MAVAYLIVGVVVVATVYFAIRYFVITRRKFGGGRIVTCPETQSRQWSRSTRVAQL